MLVDTLPKIVNDLLVRKAIFVLGGVVLLSFVYVVAMPEPSPVAPEESLFVVEPVWPLVERSVVASEDRDFVTRPLMSSTRRPPVPPAPKKQDVAQEPEPEIEPMDGVALVGVFGEAQPTGAILRFEDGTRQRVHVGETSNGWKLIALENRKATFTTANGRQKSHLEMKFATVAALPVVRQRAVPPANPGSNAPSQAGSGSIDEAPAESEVEKSVGVPVEPLTFESMYRQQREELQQLRDQNSARSPNDAL